MIALAEILKGVFFRNCLFLEILEKAVLLLPHL
jgi:hypothetical protein